MERLNNESSEEFEHLQLKQGEKNANASLFRSNDSIIVQDHSITPYNCIVKIVGVEYDNNKKCFQLGTGTKIGKNLIMTSASVLISKRTKTIFREMYFYPASWLNQKTGQGEGEQKSIRMTNCHINPRYFDKLYDQENKISE